MEQLGKTVTKIRRMANGYLLLVLEKSAANLATFRSSVEETLGEEADVKARTHETDFVIKDLDELTTKEDICAALAQQIEGHQVITIDTVKSLRKAYGGTQMAVIRLPSEAAKKIIEMGKIRVGWVVLNT